VCTVVTAQRTVGGGARDSVGAAGGLGLANLVEAGEDANKQLHHSSHNCRHI
jgi:hypothetical protein